MKREAQGPNCSVRGLAILVVLTALVEVSSPRRVSAEEQQVAGWCQDDQQWDGWWHDFDLLQPAGHECYDGAPNSWHWNVQAGKCGDFHTLSAGCVF